MEEEMIPSGEMRYIYKTEEVGGGYSKRITVLQQRWIPIGSTITGYLKHEWIDVPIAEEDNG